jgi:hypothetical protein
MLALIEAGQFPPFAYPMFEALEASAGDAPPERLALIAEDAILLAPTPFPGGGWRGFLIAAEEAKGQDREFHFAEPDQPGIWLSVPADGPDAAVLAVEGACLPIAQPHP